MKTLLLLPLLLTGCASYSHTRLESDGTSETTAVNTLLMTGKASKVTSYVKDGVYSRRVGVGEISGAGDAAFMQAVIEASMAAGARDAREER